MVKSTAALKPEVIFLLPKLSAGEVSFICLCSKHHLTFWLISSKIFFPLLTISAWHMKCFYWIVNNDTWNVFKKKNNKCKWVLLIAANLLHWNKKVLLKFLKETCNFLCVNGIIVSIVSKYYYCKAILCYRVPCFQ